jgi:hypothetical protein
MLISEYKFGKVKIGKQSYNQDLVILPDRIQTSWWRKEGHLLQLEDLEGYLDQALQMVIIGTGKYGMMKVAGEVTQWLEIHKIKSFIGETELAVQEYNNLPDKSRTIAAFHLTC